MRFCPFCSKELQDDMAHCVFCGKRLPKRTLTKADSGTVLGISSISQPGKLQANQKDESKERPLAPSAKTPPSPASLSSPKPVLPKPALPALPKPALSSTTSSTAASRSSRCPSPTDPKPSPQADKTVKEQHPSAPPPAPSSAPPESTEVPDELDLPEPLRKALSSLDKPSSASQEIGMMSTIKVSLEQGALNAAGHQQELATPDANPISKTPPVKPVQANQLLAPTETDIASLAPLPASGETPSVSSLLGKPYSDASDTSSTSHQVVVTGSVTGPFTDTEATMITPSSAAPISVAPPPPNPPPSLVPPPYTGVPAQTRVSSGAHASGGAGEKMTALDPMPIHSPDGFFAGLPYLFKVWVARFKRNQVIAAFRAEINSEQITLDQILRDLGKQARQVELQHTAIDDQMAQLLSLEEQRRSTEAESEQIACHIQRAEDRYAKIEADCKGRIDAAQAQIDAAQKEFAEKNMLIGDFRSQGAQQEKKIKSLTSKLRNRTTAATRSKDAEKQQALEQEAIDLSSQLEGLEEQRANIEEQINQLEGPIAQLTGQLADGQGRLHEAQKNLATARQELVNTRRALAEKERVKSQDLIQTDQNIDAKFLHIGRVLEAARVSHPTFETLFQSIDTLKSGIQHREAQICTLKAEREAFDREGAKRGKLVLLGIGGVALLIIVFLVLLFTLILD